jgi:hypothetical protein
MARSVGVVFVSVLNDRHARLGIAGVRRADDAWLHIAALAVGCGLARGLHLYGDVAPRIGGGLGGILAACILVHHVVAHGAVFIIGFGAAALYVLILGAALALDVVAQHGATDHANGRGCCAAAALAHGVASGAARDGAEHCAASGGALAGVHRLVGAHLARDGDLLHDGGGREHAGLFLCAGQCGGGRQNGEGDGFFHGILQGNGSDSITRQTVEKFIGARYRTGSFQVKIRKKLCGFRRFALRRRVGPMPGRPIPP